MLPISGGNGHSQEQAIVLGSEAKYLLTTIQDEIICAMDEGCWRKLGQSLIVDNGRTYDKITIHHFLDDEEEVEKIFWFDVTECFEI